MRTRSIGILLLSTLFLLAAFLPAAVQGQDILSDIVIEGNEIIEDEEIMEVIQSVPGEEYDREQLREDMEAVYDLGYFEDINVNFQNTTEGLVAVFQVQEYPVLTDINITGHEDVYTREQILSDLEISEGEILNVEQLNSGIRNLRLRFQEDGYVMARIDDVDVTPAGELNLEINIGYLNDIVLEGNEKTRDYVILRELDLEPGDPVNFDEIQRNYQQLFELGYFNDIIPDLVRVDEEDNRANLVLEIEEGNTGSLNFGAGYRQDREGEGTWFAFADVQEENLFGRGQTLSFSAQIGDEREYNLGFQEPRVSGTELSFGINVYDQYRTISTDRNRISGFSTSLGHPLTETWGGELSFKNERNQTIRQTSRSLSLAAERDTRDNPFFPRGGGFDRISTEFAGYLLGGDSRFIKYGTDTRRYYPGFNEDHAWALRLQTGFSNTDLPAHEEYRIGGPDSLRGYPGRWGDNRALANVEYRFQMIDNVQGVSFIDAGKVWNDDEEYSFSGFDHSVGVGVRLNTPIGQLRLDYAFDKDWSGTPHLSFGQTF